MSNPLAKQAGAAFLWKVLELGGTKVVFLVRTLVVARLLAPSDFGLLAVSLVAVDFLMSVTNFGLIPALVQRTANDSRHYDAAWTANLLRSVIICAAVIVSAPFIAGLFAEPRATDIIRVVAFRPVLEALVSIKVADLNRSLRFRSLTVIKLSDALVNTVVAILLALPLGVWALVAGTLAGQAVAVAASYILAPYRPRFNTQAEALRPLVHFGRWVFLTGLIAVLASSVVQAVISRELGVAELGLFYLAAKVAFLPGTVAAEVFGAVTFPLFSRLRHTPGQAARGFRSVLRGMIVTLLPACVLLAVLAPSMVGHVLGPNWQGTESLIRLLAIASAVGLFGEAVVPALNGSGQPQKVALLELVQSLTLVAFAWFLASRYGVMGAAAGWLIALAVSQVGSALALRGLLPRPFSGLATPLVAAAFASAAGAVVALTVDTAVGGVPGLALSAVLATFAVAAALWVMDQRFGLGLLADLTRAFPQLAVIVDMARVRAT